MKALTPPQELIDLVGGGDFVKVGNEFLNLYVEQGGLYPEADVLDLGCGCGRMAVPLSGFLTSGSYRGFDAHAEAIAWCQEHISTQHSNFQFEHVDAYSSRYNPSGTVRAETYRFPYREEQFDFAFASSLFTHLLSAETRNYLAETKRVLRAGGRALFTFFLLDPDALRLTSAGRTKLRFSTPAEGCYVAVADDPARAVAYTPEAVESLFTAAGLTIQHIHPGRWPGRERGLTYQDLVVAQPR